MIRTENECVDCGLPCTYQSCPYWAVTRCYCDECGTEQDVLYWWDGQQLCLDCIEAQLERVEIYDYE